MKFRRAAWHGVAAAAFGMVLTFVFPRVMGPLPEGMQTPVVAFELARSVTEVETMFGAPGSPERADYRRAMDAGNHADFGFLVAYGLFFFLFSTALVELGDRAVRVGRALSLLPPVFDVIENILLLEITRSLGGDYASLLSWLMWATWLKWFGIAAIFATWAPTLWKLASLDRFDPLDRATVASCALTALATIAAYFTRGLAAELMALSVAVTVLLATVVAFRRGARQ